MPFVNTNGIRLHYRFDGKDDAPVLVLSNSLGTTLDMWAPQIETLGRHFRLLRYDVRGHGHSAVPAGPYTLADLGHDVSGLLDALDIERAHFCGISMGGLTGQWLGVHAPTRLRSLIVANTAARIGNAEGWRSRARLVRAQGMADVVAGAAGRWFTEAFVAREPARVASLIAQLAASPAAGYAACCDALAMADLREDIARISVPTLAIAGRDDPVTTVADAHFIAQRVAQGRSVVLAASHLSNIEDDSGFDEAVLRFLAA